MRLARRRTDRDQVGAVAVRAYDRVGRQLRATYSEGAILIAF
jgi:hypothetical protein